MGNVKRRAAGTYQEAMTLCPEARQFEFRRPLELASLREGEVLVDFPSGGSYLRPYLDQVCPGVVLRPVEHVSGYLDHDRSILRGSWDRLPFDDRSVDVVLTLAALHHVLEGRPEFYREVRRVLAPGGRLIIADVEAGTRTDDFLSRFVGRCSSQGHEARFLSRSTEEPHLAKAGFEIVHYECPLFPWRYPDKDTAIAFCRGLFRLDLATDEEVWGGLRDYLGVDERPGEVTMNWQLAFVRADVR